MQTGAVIHHVSKVVRYSLPNVSDVMDGKKERGRIELRSVTNVSDVMDGKKRVATHTHAKTIKVVSALERVKRMNKRVSTWQCAQHLRAGQEHGLRHHA